MLSPLRTSISALVLAALFAGASPIYQTLLGELNPYPNKPRLVFRPDGSFKITVMSDLHFGEDPWEDWGPEQDRNSLKLMRRVLADERPDYVVINGDLMTGDNTFRENSTTIVDQIVGPLNELKIPFSSTHGNHDNHANITHLDEIIREQAVAPLSYTRLSPPGVGGIGGPGNYWVPFKRLSKVYRTAQDRSPALVLWFFDSRGGYSHGPNSTRLPDWVDETVATWIETETTIMDAVWGPSANRATLAFVHIPPHVVQPLQGKLDSNRNPGLNADLLGDGAMQSDQDTNESGEKRDSAFWNSLTSNLVNLHALVSGHVHGNEWCAREPNKDIVFCFSKHSGYGGYGSPDWGFGVRNFQFAGDVTAGVQTWIRMENGSTHANVWLDKNYLL